MYGGLSPASGESMLTGSPPSGIYGSPVHSPLSGSPKTPFLPPYLLGPGQGASETPQRSHHSHAGHLNASVLSPASQHHVTWSPDLVQRIPPSSTAHVNRFGGPPTRALDVIADTSRQMAQITSTPLDRLDGSSLVGSMNGFTPQVDSFYSQGEDVPRSADPDEAWVTVFGFPADSAKYILREFSAFGTIVHHEFASKGNWVHIQYQSHLQARKALSKNGQLFAQNTIRIGVTPCIDKDVMRRNRRKNVLPSEADDDVGTKRLKTSTSTSRIPTTDMVPITNRLFSRFDTSTPVRSGPLPAIQRFDNSSLAASPADSLNRAARVGTMRSLAAAYENPSSPRRVKEQHAAIVNGANGNLLTKAWKFIFS